jgi:hypothetical protein
VLKALALGATAVGIGRPYVWGLASFGEAGVDRVLQILDDEFVMIMRQTGALNINQITRDNVARIKPRIDICRAVMIRRRLAYAAEHALCLSVRVTRMSRLTPKTVRRRFFVAAGHAIGLTWPVLSIILAFQLALGLLIGLH